MFMQKKIKEFEMKTLYSLCTSALLLLISCPGVFSQIESQPIYYTNDISIDYSDDSLIAASTENGKSIKINVVQNLDDINTVCILSDSIISVSGNKISNAKLSINKINSISVKNGTHAGIGIGLGALVGLGVGVLIVYNTNTEPTPDPLTNIVLVPATVGLNLIWGILSTISGALIGGIIGGNISSYDKYHMDKFKYNKKNQLERILRLDGNLNRENR